MNIDCYFMKAYFLESSIPVGSPRTDVPQAPRSNGRRCRVIKAATTKEGFFAITVNDVDAIGVIVGVELERGAAERKLFAETETKYGR